MKIKTLYAWLRKFRRFQFVLFSTIAVAVLFLLHRTTITVDFAHNLSLLSASHLNKTRNSLLLQPNPGNWMLPHLLNITNFSWNINNITLCQLSSNTTNLLTILVHSARSHFQNRETIRNSWASVRSYKTWKIQVVFLLGKQNPNDFVQTPLQQQEIRIEKEANEFGDIVLGNFVDSYRNLTYKHLMGYKWILNFCRNATFVLKVDDDMFVNTIKWINWISEASQWLECNIFGTPDLYCSVIKGAKPMKSTRKWYVSKEEWPLEIYPNYCSGWGYGITVSLIEKIYSMSDHAKYFWIDDIFVTGLLLELVNAVYVVKPVVKNIASQVNDQGGTCFVNDNFPLVLNIQQIQRNSQCVQDMSTVWKKSWI